MVYKTQGTCSREIHFDVENNKLKNVSFVGGCNGNLKGIGLLVEGMDIDEVIKRVEGVSCNGRPTSCPDQLAKALKQYKEQQAQSIFEPIDQTVYYLSNRFYTQKYQKALCQQRNRILSNSPIG